MLYLFSGFQNDTYLIQKWSPLLSDERKKKTQRYKFLKDRLLSTAAFVLLRYALFTEYNITKVPEFIIPENEKPVLKEFDIHFNLSHCVGAVLCSVGKKPSGCDVQDYTDSVIKIKKKIISPNEEAVFTDVKGLTRLWTLKEAFGKYSGDGICYDHRSADFSGIESSPSLQLWRGFNVLSEEREEFAYSLVSEEKMELIDVPKEKLLSFAQAFENG